MKYIEITNNLKDNPRKWLITGVAGFIGSNLLETLLKLDQEVVGIDNFATGYQHNIDEVKSEVRPEQWSRFTFIRGDITKLSDCRRAVAGIDYVLHQAALGSVPRSIADPLATHEANVNGFLNMLIASKDEQVSSYTYASSSSCYGDHPALPKEELNIGVQLSPYAVSKYVNELYAQIFSSTYGFRSIGLRYFNVFGKRQDPNGVYAAVIPKWTAAMIAGDTVFINGDGVTSRDFCYVENAVQMNILSAVAPETFKNQVYNVAVGDRTTLNDLYSSIKDVLSVKGINVLGTPEHREHRKGDVRHSQASIDKSTTLLGYEPKFHLYDGLIKTIPWYLSSQKDKFEV